MNENTIVLTSPARFVIDASVQNEIQDWLMATAERLGIRAKIYTETAKPEGRWLYINVDIVDENDSFTRVSELQEMEDSWNDREPKPVWGLVLIPAGK